MNSLWLAPKQGLLKEVEAVEFSTHTGQQLCQEVVYQNDTDSVTIFHCLATRLREGEVVWTCEAAKFAQWQTHTQRDWTVIHAQAIVETEQASEWERVVEDSCTGFSMPTWPILDSIRQTYGLDSIIWPTMMEAQPLFPTWLTMMTGYNISPDLNPLILLDAIPQADREEVLAQALQCAWWVVVSRKRRQFQPPRMLADSGKPHGLLTQDKAKVYQKGWYAHGTKKTFGGCILQYWTKQEESGVNFD